jgi:hypothetical protein
MLNSDVLGTLPSTDWLTLPLLLRSSHGLLKVLRLLGADIWALAFVASYRDQLASQTVEIGALNLLRAAEPLAPEVEKELDDSGVILPNQYVYA